MRLIKIFEDNEDSITKLRYFTKDRVEEAIRRKYGIRFTVEFFGSIRYVD